VCTDCVICCVLFVCEPTFDLVLFVKMCEVLCVNYIYGRILFSLCGWLDFGFV